VLPHCPYHAQIDFFRAARDTFLESQGLLDLQEFEVRREILDRQKAVAIEELVYREDMTMMWSGLGRIVNVAIDYFRLLSLVRGSDNWTTEYDRLTSINILQFAMEAYTTFGKVTKLWAEAQYAAAGKALADGMFPERQAKEGNLDWPALPYQPVHQGEEVAGYVWGAINAFTGVKSTDNLAGCISESETLLLDFRAVDESLMKRSNEDVVQGLAHLAATYKSLSSYVAGCSDQTKQQVQMVEARLVATDEAKILANLAEHKNHVELTLAKMKMQASLHDFPEWG